MAIHMPEGGLDSRNRREALRRRPELAVDDRLRPASEAPSVGDAGVRGGGESCLSLSMADFVGNR